MSELGRFTISELEREIADRKEREQLPTPNINDAPDFAVLKRCVEQYIQQIELGGYRMKDGYVYIAEAAIGAFYGQDIWKWIKERCR